MEKASTSVLIQNAQCDVVNISIADKTGCISLALWNNLIDKVQRGKTYNFTELSTRTFNSTLSMTTTKNTVIKQADNLDIDIDMDAESEKSELPTIQTDISGIKIQLNKQCPKCHTNQENMAKAQFHRCEGCKILRKSSSYNVHFNGIMTIDNPELTLTLSNMVLQTFLKETGFTQYSDAQDIEEYFLSTKMTITYTSDDKISEISL